MPSIVNLTKAGLLDTQTRIIGADHNPRDTEGWRKELGDALREFGAVKGSESAEAFSEAAWTEFARRLEYVKFDFTADADYAGLARQLHDAKNILFYFAVSPRFFQTIAQGLAKVQLLQENGGSFRRVVVEKPFGRDVASARELNTALTSIMSSSQIFRIDHFLGKDAVRGISALRFGGRMFEPLLSRESIAAVQITAAETVGVEDRGSFYETTGALRDMIPNHLFSLMTLLAMEAPPAWNADAVQDAKTRLLRDVRTLTAADAVRGQYGAGNAGGKTVRAYREEDGVARDSRIETYTALALQIDNERWRGVPFFLRTGKCMAAHVTTIVLRLREPAGLLDAETTAPQVLIFGVDPQRGIVQRFAAKAPGVGLELGSARTGFRYDQVFDEPPNIGYEALLYDVLRGEAVLFQRADMIEREWEIVDPVLEAWEAEGAPELYAAGSAGPAGADALLERFGERWFDVAALDDLGKTAA